MSEAAGPRRGRQLVLCFDDQRALQLLSASNRAGINVPDDLSIIGFDDIPFASISNPALGTFAVPYERMGQMACAMLIGQLATGSLAAPVSVAVRLMLRSTTTPRTGSRS